MQIFQNTKEPPKTKNKPFKSEHFLFQAFPIRNTQAGIRNLLQKVGWVRRDRSLLQLIFAATGMVEWEHPKLCCFTYTRNLWYCNFKKRKVKETTATLLTVPEYSPFMG